MKKKDLKVTLGYVPENCSEDLAVSISEMKITYCQNADTCSAKDEVQLLTIESENNGMGEDGYYYNIKIDTKWSVDDPDDIGFLIRDFQKRMSLNTVKEADLKTY